MVLDSNVDPRHVWFQANLNQNPDFDRNVKIWFQWLAQYHDTFQLGSTDCQVEQTWNAVLKDLKKHPVDGVVGPDEWLDAFLEVAYSQSVWIQYGNIFADWVHNQNGTGVVSIYEDANTPGDDNSYAVYLAVQAADKQWPRDVNYVLNQNWFSYTKAPIFTWENAWYNGPDQFWPVLTTKPVTVDGTDVGGILLVSETLDASKPFEGDLEVRRRFPRSSLLAVEGGTSHSRCLHGYPCVDNVIAAYLGTGELPTRQPGNGPDVSCPALPKPNPTAAKNDSRRRHSPTILFSKVRKLINTNNW